MSTEIVMSNTIELDWDRVTVIGPWIVAVIICFEEQMQMN